MGRDEGTPLSVHIDGITSNCLYCYRLSTTTFAVIRFEVRNSKSVSKMTDTLFGDQK